MYTLEGVCSDANFIIFPLSSHFLLCNVLFVSKGNLFFTFIYYTAASVSAVRRPYNVFPVFHLSAVYILFPLGSLGLLWYL